MVVSESLENYLETILMLSKKLPVVRSVDIASHLDFKKSSVSVAMKTLRENGYISVSEEGWINLTDEGLAVANTVYEKHLFISSWLESLGVDKSIAAEDACKIEHVISNESFLAIKKHVQDTQNS
jgi:Mn-dependent DtxR family transcriptional regulator